jgi:hypothetical protein
MALLDVKQQRWRTLQRVLGPDHPATRAAFGRFAAARGWTITDTSAGLEAFRAWARVALRPGTFNRSHRKYLKTLPDWYWEPNTP